MKHIIKNAKEIYPLTIISDRYCGAYSGGQFLAWNMDHDTIPDEVKGADIPCMEFWEQFKQDDSISNAFKEKVFVGKGATTGDAVADLIKQLNSVQRRDSPDKVM